MNVATKRVFKRIGWTAVSLLTAVSALLGYVQVVSDSRMSQAYSVSVPQLSIPSDAASIARGKYLVESVSQCIACHGADLGGKTMHDDFAMGRIASANLTRGRGGIGANYTDEDFVRALMHGVRPDGRSVVFMPSADYAFTERDLANVIAYVKSVPPVDREHPSPAPGPLMRALSVFGDFPLSPAARIDHERVGFAAPRDEDDPVAAGEQLVASAGCIACHGRDFAGGGGPPPGAGNITPVGLSSWTEKDFITAIREHRRPNGTVISDTMPRGYGLMSDADLRRIFAFLRTLPPKGQLTGNQQ